MTHGDHFHFAQKAVRRFVQRDRRGVFANRRGQALTEFLVVALALVPLMLLIPVIAKYQDITYATQMASRYVAFDGLTRNDFVSSWKPVDQLEEEIRRRFFGNSDAPVKTNDAAGNFAAHRNPFWTDPNGKSLIADFDDVKVSFGVAAGASHGDGFSTASDGDPFKSDLLKGVPYNVSEKLGLPARGIYTANVSVALLNLPALKSYKPFDTINLSIKRHTSLLLDPWTGAGPSEVQARLDNALVFPGKLLEPVKPVVDVAVTLVESPSCIGSGTCIPGPKLGELDFWRDVVPSDRLH